MSRIATPCKGFTFPAVPIEVIQSWNIPGVKIEAEGAIHSRRCVNRGTKRAPVCKECNQMEAVVALLVENIEDDKNEESEHEPDPPATPKRPTPRRSARGPSKDESTSGQKPEKPKESPDEMVSLMDAEDQTEEAVATVPKKKKAKRAAANKPELEDQLQVVLDSLPATLPDQEEANVDGQGQDGELPVEAEKKPTKRTRKRARKASDSSAEFGKPTKRRSERIKKTTADGSKKSIADPVNDLCRSLILKARKSDDHSAVQKRTIPCLLCKKEISFFSKDGRVATYKARNHALTHLEQRFYKCRICDEQKILLMHSRMHILIRHRDHASADDWKEFMIDESILEENRPLIMDTVTKCFDHSQNVPVESQDTVAKEKEPENRGEQNEQAPPPEIEDNQNQPQANTGSIDTIRDYCLRLIREKQNNGHIKCQLCKNVSVNVSFYNTDSMVIQRMKTHAFLHQLKRFYRCRVCDFMTTTTVLMSRHLNATHGKRRRGEEVKFDDLSILEENRTDVLKALERCFENERVNTEANEAAAIILQEAAIVDAPAAFVYLLPNGDLVLPGDIEHHSGDLGLDGSFQNVNRIPPGCIVTLQTPEGLEEMTVLLQ